MHARIKLPVALNDENTSVRSTIKSPDAEKLCPFTTSEIQRLEEEGQSVMNDISFALDNTEVVFSPSTMTCSLVMKSSEVVILKTYTVDEVTAFTKNMIAEKGEPSAFASDAFRLPSDKLINVPPAPNKEDESQPYFLTPITKKLLEEVGQQCGLAEAINSQPTNAKRSIIIGTITDEDLNNIASDVSDTQPTKNG